MKHLTPKEKEIFDYMVKIEKLNFAKCGKFGIFPTTTQIVLVFGISRQRVHEMLPNIKKHLENHLNQK